MSELLSVLHINIYGGCLTGLYHCQHTNYCCAFRFYRVVFAFMFSTKPKCFIKQLLAADFSYCWLYLSKQAVDHFMLFACLYHVLFSRLKHSVEQVLAADLSTHTELVLTDYWV